MKVISYNTGIYKGADFIFKFRFKFDGVYEDLSESVVYFNASNSPDGTNVFELSSADSPATITIDPHDNYLVTVTISDVETSAIDIPELYYEVDVMDSAGIRTRRMNGILTVFGDAL